MSSLVTLGLMVVLVSCTMAYDLKNDDDFIKFDDMEKEEIPDDFYDSEAASKFLAEHPATEFGDILGLDVKNGEIVNVALETEGFNAMSYKETVETPFWKQLKEGKVKRNEQEPPKCGCPSTKRQIAKRTGTPLKKEEDKGKWTHHTVVWYFESAGPNITAYKVAAALEKLAKMVDYCVEFKQLKEQPGDEDAVAIVIGRDNPEDCRSFIGMTGGNQPVVLGEGCGHESTIQHEFMHVLGFLHEHMRPDRAQSVNVHFENIDNKMCRQFALCKQCETYAPYNSKSIMQYRSDAFSCNGKNVVVNKDGSLIRDNQVVQKTDLKAITDLYQCVM